MFHLRQLQCALALAECGSFGDAARQIGITPSGLTQSIQRLEEHYGSELFVRSRNGVSLTPTGEIVLDGARAIIERAAAVEREIGIADKLEEGHLRLGIDPTLGNPILAPALSAMLRQYPRLQITVTSGSRATLSRLLNNREIDLCVSYPSRSEQMLHVETIDFMIPAPILVGRAGHPLLDLPDRKIKDYFVYPRLGARVPEWYVHWATEHLQSDGVDLDPAYDYYLSADNIGLMKAVVANSDALMGLYRPDVQLELTAGVLVQMDPVDWPDQIPVEVSFAAGRPLALPGKKMLDAILCPSPS
jgi:DNA-binding transcriptional LysR family regulator